MTTVTVVHHYVDGSWWAEAEGHPGYLAVANTLDELHELVREGLPFFLEVDSVEIDARYDVETAEMENQSEAAPVTLTVTSTAGPLVAQTTSTAVEAGARLSRTLHPVLSKLTVPARANA
jgi:predicted RNase H-like HicB family nuclease